MRYREFEKVMSAPRMNRYLAACGNDSRKAMTLYRHNLRLSQELFTVVSCFEIALRNAIDQHYVGVHGQNWLRDAAQAGGFFDNNRCRVTADTVLDTYRKIRHVYSHPKLVAGLGFGFWRYMFGTPQFRAAGKTLIRIFANKPTSTPQQQYNAAYVFQELTKVNELRNRIAHHEPVCFRNGNAAIDTAFANDYYQVIITLFEWLGIDEGDLMFGLDKVQSHINKINNL